MSRSPNRFRTRAFAATALLVMLAGLVACQRSPQPQPATPAPAAPAAPWAASQPLPPLFDDIERRTFDYFWELGDPRTGLVPDRWPTPSFSSIAAVGFGLTAYGVGVERGWISREQAAGRTLATLRFFANAPQGPARQGMSGHKGFYYHFLEMDDGTRSASSELSTVDTTLLLAGVLFAQSYYDGDGDGEAEIRRLAEQIYRRVEWPWAQARGPRISMGWAPEQGALAYDWQGYNEAILVYILALASPTHPVGTDAYAAWTSTYDDSWGTFHGQQHLSFPPLFGHQYSQIWVDFRGILDPWMREHGLDYFENSRRATYAQQAYAIANPGGWAGYGEQLWGLTACDGPIDASFEYGGRMREFRTYSARGAGIEYVLDDGTIAPTAALGSLPFAPEIVVPMVEAMHARYGEHVYAQYGFLDAFNPSFTFDAPLMHGKVVEGVGWVDGDYIGIDQGPIVLGIANHRDGFVWKVMRRNPHIRRGLERAGFTGGWLDEAAPPAEGDATAQPQPAPAPQADEAG